MAKKMVNYIRMGWQSKKFSSPLQLVNAIFFSNNLYEALYHWILETRKTNPIFWVEKWFTSITSSDTFW